MTTRSGARIYRGQSHPLQPGACAQCGRVVTISPSGRRRAHLNLDGRPCPGGRVFVGDPQRVVLDELPDIVMPAARRDELLFACGWRPRRKADGDFVAHRIRPDDPAAPYCENGAKRCY